MATHFFKVMMPGYLDKLNLPLEFCKKMKQEKSEWANLTSRMGKWEINVCRNGEGAMCFQDGWPQFVNHHALSIGEIVLFQHTANLHFNVFVFDSTACEKEFLLQPKKEQQHPPNQELNPNHHPSDNFGESDKQTDTPDHSEDPHFVLTMKPYHAAKKSYVHIPTKFVTANKLQQMKIATLRGPCGRKWPVKLISQGTGQSRLRMSKGWHDFYVSKKLKEGDVCVFTLNRGSTKSLTILLDVQISPPTP